MRINQLWDRFPLSAKLNLFWERITFSRITKFYFLFSVLHCLVQLVFQIQAFSINAQAASFLYKLVEQGHTFDPGFSVMTPNDLRFCDTVPTTFSTANCQVIWSANIARNDTVQQNLGSSNTLPSVPSSTSATSSIYEMASSESTSIVGPEVTTVTKSVTTTVSPGTLIGVITSPTASPTPGSPTDPVIVSGNQDDDDDESDDRDESHRKRDSVGQNGITFGMITAVNINGSTEVFIDGFGWNKKNVSLSQRCLYTLNWPVETLDDTKREDVTFIAFQIWVLGMSIAALLNESMPHVIASLLTHVLATAWGGYQIFHTADFRKQFIRLTTDGACGVNLLPTYWKERAAAEIPSLVLNAVALLLSAFLSWRLIKSFGWQTFKRVGASRTINRVYMLVLMLSIAIQLSVFFIVASIGLWIDQLYNGAVGHMASRGSVYKGVLIMVLVLLVPWLTLGWISVRRELKVPMLIFLVMSVGYLGGWGAMFASTTFRWTFVLWRFFMLITSASVFLTLVTLVLGIVCRVNFGKGLSRYLNAQEPLPDNFGPTMSDDAEYGDEKVEFPSGRSIPTFSAAFGSGAEVPPPSQMRFGPPHVGPRFFNPPAESFDPQPPFAPVHTVVTLPTQTTYSSDTYAREAGTAKPAGSAGPLFSTTQLSRQISVGSQQSDSSYRSDNSADSYRSDRSINSHERSNSGDSRRNDIYVDRSKRWVIE